jgi:hypothetical protein
MLAVACLAGVVATAACGGDAPAPIASTLTPTPGAVESYPPGTPTPTPSPSTSGAAVTGATSQPTSDGAAHTATPSGTPSAGQTGTPAPSDATITADLIRRLSTSPVLVGADIRVFVRKHVVYLGGTVDRALQKRAAEHIALTEPGVVKVVSYLRVAAVSGY